MDALRQQLARLTAAPTPVAPPAPAGEDAVVLLRAEATGAATGRALAAGDGQ